MNNQRNLFPNGKNLSVKEKLALRMLCEGKRRSEIASTFNISPSAFDKRIDRAKSKLGARTTHEAVALYAVDLSINDSLALYRQYGDE